MSSEGAGVDETALRAGKAARIRVRMRRRLIGAAALLLGTAVVVPMMLDPAPRPLPDNIPVDIPSERTPFAPRLSLPPAPGAPSSAPGATAGEPAAAPGATEGKPAEPQAKADVGQPAAAPAAGAGEGSPSEAKAGSPDEARSAKSGQWFVQAAALSSESAARQLSERLTKAGLAPFVERTDAAGSTLYRVRLGPYASRDAAVKVRRHLHAMGVGSNVVRVEEAQR
jgi:DedD protein